MVCPMHCPPFFQELVTSLSFSHPFWVTLFFINTFIKLLTSDSENKSEMLFIAYTVIFSKSKQ